jgi:hypothetical protein
LRYLRFTELRSHFRFRHHPRLDHYQGFTLWQANVRYRLRHRLRGTPQPRGKDSVNGITPISTPEPNQRVPKITMKRIALI